MGEGTVTPMLTLTVAFASIIAFGTLVTWAYDTLAAAYWGREGSARLVPLGAQGRTVRSAARRSFTGSRAPLGRTLVQGSLFPEAQPIAMRTSAGNAVSTRVVTVRRSRANAA